MQIAIILAAGKSTRMKGIDKIFYEINRKPIIFYTLSVFEKSRLIKKIIVVTRRKNFKKLRDLIEKYKFKKVESIISGGKERQISAFKGLKEAERLGAKKGDLILFHNAANPLLSQKEIERVIKFAKKYKAALLAQPARDTIKLVNKRNEVLKTLDRKRIFLAQTPQVIEYSLAKLAFEKAKREKFLGTDDVSLVERLGVRPKVVKTSFKNIKITYPEDLKFVQFYIK